FGAPLAHDNDPERAIRAALDIHNKLRELSAELDVSLKAHIGIASGQVVASDTGSDAHREYTVTGNSVNLASRLDDMAGPGETLVSKNVHDATTAMAAFAEAQTCRRQVLLNYFGEYNQNKCNNCDICLDPPKQFDGTEDAQKALSCVYRLNQRFGIAYTVEVLRGAQTQRIKDYGHDKISTWGIGKDHSPEHWLSVIRQLIHHGYLIQDITQASVLKLTEAARPVLRSQVDLKLAVPRIRPAKTAKASKKTAKITNYDKKLFSLLKNLRKQIADEAELPPYIVFSDATLAEMASILPVSDDEMLAINGVGQTKLTRYARKFAEVIRQYA
ncbi:MAG: HRDC domain-containing protein, partial [Psychrosphaera sp.]|nr:HRDC domain-containing protein [Psychrosphaera sp.]